MPDQSELEQDQSQKTEEPTARQLEKAREEGMTAISREVSHWFVILGTTLIVAFLAPTSLTQLLLNLKSFLILGAVPLETKEDLFLVMNRAFQGMVYALWLPIVVLMIAGIFAGFSQTRFLISFIPLKPKLDKISLSAGVKRLFSFRSLIEFAKGLLKIAIVTTILWFLLKPEFSQINKFTSIGLTQILKESQRIVLKLLIAVLAVMAVVAGIDYLYQRYEYLKKLRMTKQQVRQELKETEGDPLIRQRIREIRRQRANQRLMSKVPRATVVITNPTHYAVALRYVHGEMEAPVVEAKGVDFLAQRIREIAKTYEIPIIQNPSLAKALYSNAQIDQEIPEKYYEAVAKIIRYLMGLEKEAV